MPTYQASAIRNYRNDLPASYQSRPYWYHDAYDDSYGDVAAEFSLQIPAGSVIDSAIARMKTPDVWGSAWTLALYCHGVRGGLPDDLLSPLDYPPTDAYQARTFTPATWLAADPVVYDQLAAVIQELVDELSPGETLTTMCLLWLTATATDTGGGFWSGTPEETTLEIVFRMPVSWSEGGTAGDAFDGNVTTLQSAQASDGGKGGDWWYGTLATVVAAAWTETFLAGDISIPLSFLSQSATATEGGVARDVFEPRSVGTIQAVAGDRMLGHDAWTDYLVPIIAAGQSDGELAGDQWQGAYVWPVAWAETAVGGDVAGSAPERVTIVDVVLRTPEVAEAALRTV